MFEKKDKDFAYRFLNKSAYKKVKKQKKIDETSTIRIPSRRYDFGFNIDERKDNVKK